MLKKIFITVVTTLLVPITLYAQKTGYTKYKCMLQMTNYNGEAAYIVVSLLNSKGDYEKTLGVMGPDKKWYSHLKDWNKFTTKKKENISAITGASVAGGDRSIAHFEIEDSKLNAGYKLRFETAVEDQKYHSKDLEVPFTKEAMNSKSEGNNYIRYVRFSAN